MEVKNYGLKKAISKIGRREEDRAGQTGIWREEMRFGERVVQGDIALAYDAFGEAEVAVYPKRAALS